MGAHLKIFQISLMFTLLSTGFMEDGHALKAANQLGGSVVINEIHYDPDVKTELVEFIELYNPGSIDVDLTGWYFNDGILYQFPVDSILPAGEYVIVAQNPEHVQEKWGKGRLDFTENFVYGPFEGKLGNNREKIELCNANGEQIDQVDYQLGFPWPTVGYAVPNNQSGTGCSIQLINPMIDNDLGGSWRSALPTPAAYNTSVFQNDSPSHLRQVEHQPQQPKSGELVTITAKVTDNDGIDSVTLDYQVVEPGHYIRISDSKYQSDWDAVSMHDDGQAGDELAGDDIYTVVLPGSIQAHRNLVRYRIRVMDLTSRSIVVPYSDDPQPNFAYFIYDGVPAWNGAIRPGYPGPSGEVVEYNTDVMRSLPVYHLIADAQDVQNCQYNRSYENLRFNGTLVYDGIVYDHIEYKIRGEWSTYESGKNKWKFFFTRGHDFQARDNYGEKYNTRWSVMNLSACASPWLPVNRGMGGMDEAVAFKLYNLSGVPSSKTNFLQFRVIDEVPEADRNNQYQGDLWGLYMAIEHPDGRFLDEHDLPDGNTYKMESQGDKKNQGPTQSRDNSDLNTFKSGYGRTNTTTWWKENLNLDRYYSFRAINRAINNMDVREGWNVYYYHDPQTDLWTVIPWDLDMLYLPVTHWSGVLNIQNCLRHPEFEIGYQNRGRELQDLLLTPDQIGQLVDELAAFVNPPARPQTMTDVDQAMWNYHPRTASNHRGMFYKNPFTHNDFNGQSIVRSLVSADHEGMMQWIKDFIQFPPGGGSSYTGNGAFFYNGADFLDSEVSDNAIPRIPTITYTGSEEFPADALTFEVSSFSDPQGSGTFSAMTWRLAEVEPDLPPAETGLFQGIKGKYEIDAVWESEEISPYSRRMTLPVGVAKPGQTYRVRCRMKDTTGRWSHWSNPIQFVAGQPSSDTLAFDLRVTELMYNPANADTANDELAVDNENFEFVELKNIGSETIELTQVRFTNGIDFTFPAIELGAGEYVVVIHDPNAFETRYGPALNIAGTYTGRLDNGGERIRLENSAGQTIQDFRYDDAWYDITDGQGFSLTIIDPTDTDPNSWDQEGSWRTSVDIGGSPGWDDMGDF